MANDKHTTENFKIDQPVGYTLRMQERVDALERRIREHTDQIDRMIQTVEEATQAVQTRKAFEQFEEANRAVEQHMKQLDRASNIMAHMHAKSGLDSFLAGMASVLDLFPSLPLPDVQSDTLRFIEEFRNRKPPMVRALEKITEHSRRISTRMDALVAEKSEPEA